MKTEYVCDRCGAPEGRCYHKLDQDYAVQELSTYRRECRFLGILACFLIGFFIGMGIGFWRWM